MRQPVLLCEGEAFGELCRILSRSNRRKSPKGGRSLIRVGGHGMFRRKKFLGKNRN